MTARQHLLAFLAGVLALTALAQPVGAAPAAAPALTYAYTVQLGDTLATISRKFGVSADRILDLNNLRTRPNIIYVGETLTLPIDMGFTPSYVSPFFYVVQTGDTVQSLNNRFYIDPFSLRRFNNLAASANVLTPGVKLLIPAGPHRYTVQSGDSIQSVAAKFSSSVNSLLRFNPHLGSGAALAPGQNVYVPIVFDIPFTPIPGTSALPDGTGGGGLSNGGVSPRAATGLQPTDVVNAQALNASVVTGFQTIHLPQNVVNLNGELEVRWAQLRRVRRDPSRENGAILTVAVQFRGGDGKITVQHYETVGGVVSPRGLLVTGIFVNAGDLELWNDIEVDVPGTCSAGSRDTLIITSGGKKQELNIEFWTACP